MRVTRDSLMVINWQYQIFPAAGRSHGHFVPMACASSSPGLPHAAVCLPSAPRHTKSPLRPKIRGPCAGLSPRPVPGTLLRVGCWPGLGAEQEQGHGGAVVAASLAGLGRQSAHGAQGDGSREACFVTALHCRRGERCSARHWEARGELLLCQEIEQTSSTSHAAVLNCSISHVWALLEQGLASSLHGSIPAPPSWASAPGSATRQAAPAWGWEERDRWWGPAAL